MTYHKKGSVCHGDSSWNTRSLIFDKVLNVYKDYIGFLGMFIEVLVFVILFGRLLVFLFLCFGLLCNSLQKGLDICLGGFYLLL